MRMTTLLVVALEVALWGCDGAGERDTSLDTDSDRGSSVGSDVSSGQGVTGDTSSSSSGGDASSSTTTGNDGSTTSQPDATGGETGTAQGLEVLNVQSAASAMNGDSLSIAQYSVPADGILVVHGGAAGPPVQSVTFGGVELTAIESRDEPNYWFALSADIYWMPVVAGQRGEIVWQYQPGEWTTRRRGAIAATVAGADEVHAVATGSDGLGTNEGRSGPAVAEVEISTSRESVIITAFTSNGPGPSDLLGSGHTLDAFPTIPIEEFHSTRVYGGHATVGPGTYTLGYQNNETNGWFDYILFAVAFSSSE